MNLLEILITFIQYFSQYFSQYFIQYFIQYRRVVSGSTNIPCNYYDPLNKKNA